MCIGMNDAVAIAHDRAVPPPEDQIAALQSVRFRCVQCAPETVLLHVAVARAAGARGVQCDLDEAGAVDATTALAAPQIGRADEAFGDRDEIILHGLDAADMPA